MSFLESVKRFDLFGKEPEFYIKGKPKHVTIIGRVFTYLYIAIYIVFVVYKLYRMYQRVDITFYDSLSNTDEVPSISITNNNFSIIFTMQDDDGNPFINETIYRPEVYYYDDDDEKVFIQLSRCTPEALKPKYLEQIPDLDVNNYYCLGEFDVALQPYDNSIIIDIYPCVNTTEDGQECQPKDVIEEALDNHVFFIYFEDVILTPTNFDNPIRKRINFVNTEIYFNLGIYLYTEMQLVKIETSTNIIGFDFLTEPKLQEYVKFEKEQVYPNPGYYSDEEEEGAYPLGTYEVQLNDKILSEKREYIQLVDVLGEIGGFMEIMESFFAVICSIVVDVLYEKKMANNLFTFDTQKRLIFIKSGKSHKFKISEEENVEEDVEEVKTYSPKLVSFKTKNIDEEKISASKIKKKKINNKSNGILTKNKNSSEIKSVKKGAKIENFILYANKDNHDDIDKQSFEIFKKQTKKHRKSTDSDKINIISKITLRDQMSSIFYCCSKNKGKAYNIVLKETVKIIREKLDIFNIFRNLGLIEHSNSDINKNLEIMKMSDECSNGLSTLRYG